MMLPSLRQWAIGLLIIVGSLLVARLVVWVFKRTRILTSHTKTTIDDTVFRLVRRPVSVGFGLAGIVTAAEYLFPDVMVYGYGYAQLIPVLVVLWGAYLVNRLVHGLMQWKEAQVEMEQGGAAGYASFGFLNTIVSLLVWGVAITLILNYLGVDVTALVAGLGIAGVAVALALQNTLSGLFSAVGLALDRPIRHGDFIRLENGTEGFVEDISMRSTRIRTFDQSLVIVPNSKLSEMILVNMYLPAQEMSMRVPLTVGYGSDLERVEAVLIETASATLDTLGAGSETLPFVRFQAFGDSAIELSVFLNIKRVLDQYLVKHTFLKAVHVRFAQEGIDIPFPQLDVRIEK